MIGLKPILFKNHITRKWENKKLDYFIYLIHFISYLYPHSAHCAFSPRHRSRRRWKRPGKCRNRLRHHFSTCINAIIYKNFFTSKEKRRHGGKPVAAARHKKSAAYGFASISNAIRPAAALIFPLYKKADRRYNKNRNVPRIRLRMERLFLRMQEAGGFSTRFCIALFCAYIQIIPLLFV